MASREFEISIPLTKKEWTTLVEFLGLKLTNCSISEAHEKKFVKWARDTLLTATLEKEEEEEEEEEEIEYTDEADDEDADAEDEEADDEDADAEDEEADDEDTKN